MNTFKPYDRVLVRDYDNEKWTSNFFSHYEGQLQHKICIDGFYWQVIPYNESTSKLVGTTNPYVEQTEVISWKPVDKDCYYHISFIMTEGGVSVIEDYWLGDDIDNFFYETGNCFKTRELAEVAAEQIRQIFTNAQKQ